jgi:hypothetical protein
MASSTTARSVIGAAVLLLARLPLILAACNRTALLEWASNFVDAQSLGNAGHLDGLTDNFVYRQNDMAMNLTAGILKQKLHVDHNCTIADDDDATCATYTEIVSATDPALPFVIGTQIRHRPADMKATLIDSVVSTTGSWLFNATSTLSHVQQEAWSVLETSHRSARPALRAAADAYLDMWSNASAAATVPWGTPCSRLEGGAYTGSGKPSDSCKVSIPTNSNQAPNSHRRYVVDESVGSISVLCVFEHLQNASDSHEFRLEDGKLRYVHTITVPQNARNRVWGTVMEGLGDPARHFGISCGGHSGGSCESGNEGLEKATYVDDIY